ncbi:LytR/AlgR family response regulator transcription factor [Flavitalea sp.]|nr:LytTR family DNA-binding domain-containing protein [Flavitalea sp.]
MDKLTCVIIEDNRIDAEFLASFITRYDFLLLKQSFGNVLEAKPFLDQFNPDVLFLDIDMPFLNGMDFFKMISPAPVCIFVTAHSEFAWEGFESQAFDFILKPLKDDRFRISMNRLKEYISLRKRADIYDSQVNEYQIVVKDGYTKYQINFDDILYIEALKDYSKVVTVSSSIMTLSKLKHLTERLPNDKFIRIHRSYTISKNKIVKKDSNDVWVAGVKLPIGKTFRTNLNMIL